MPGTGAKGHIGLAKETTWGTPVAATDYMAISSESIVHEIEQVIEQEIRGYIDAAPQYEGLNSIRGDIVALARPVGIGFLLRSCLGAPVTSGAGPYTHIFSTAADFSDQCVLPPYTFEVNRNLSQAFQFAGCVVNELVFEFGVTQKILKITASIMGKAVVLIAPTTVSLEAADPFKWLQAVFNIGGSAITDIESCRIRIANNLELIQSLNATKVPARILWGGNREVDIDLTFGVYNLTEYTRFTGQGEATASVTLTVDASTELKFETNKLRYVGFPLSMSGPGRMTVNITGKAKYDATLGTAIKATLKNSKVSY